MNTMSASEPLTLEVTSEQSQKVPQSEDDKFICSLLISQYIER